MPGRLLVVGLLVSVLVAFGTGPLHIPARQLVTAVAVADTLPTDTNLVMFDIGGIRVTPLPVPTDPNVWSWFVNNVSACPAGDSVAAGHPAKLRIIVRYRDADGNNKSGVPGDSVWIVLDEAFHNLVVNDMPAQLYADQSVENGWTRITLPGFSGCGRATFKLYVTGEPKGSFTATVRTTDADADGRVVSPDLSSPCDLNYDGLTNDEPLACPHFHHPYANWQQDRFVLGTWLGPGLGNRTTDTTAVYRPFRVAADAYVNLIENFGELSFSTSTLEAAAATGITVMCGIYPYQPRDGIPDALWAYFGGYPASGFNLDFARVVRERFGGGFRARLGSPRGEKAHDLELAVAR